MNEQIGPIEPIEPMEFQGRSKHLGLRILAAVILFALVIALFDFLSFMFYPSIHYVFPATSCSILFGVTPEEFQTTDLDLFRETGDLRKRATVNDEGLILSLTRREARALRNSEWLTDFSQYADGETISLSSDLKEITVYYNCFYLSDEMSQEIKTRLTIISYKIAIMQNIDGLSEEECVVMLRWVETASGSVSEDYIIPPITYESE